jgi:hypothetical protein
LTGIYLVDFLEKRAPIIAGKGIMVPVAIVYDLNVIAALTGKNRADLLFPQETKTSGTGLIMKDSILSFGQMTAALLGKP